MPSARSPTNVPPPPPPPPESSSAIGGKPSHPVWNSLVSDITMSEDEDGRHYHHPEHRQPTTLHHRTLDDSAASVLEYSQSSDEGGHGSQRRKQHREKSSSSNELFGSGSSFRFREDLTSSNRIVRFASSSELESNDSGDAADQEGSPLQLGHDNAHHDKHRHHGHHRRHNRATVNRETFLATSNRWVTQLAYSFRTPPAPRNKKQPVNDPEQSNSSSGPANNNNQDPPDVPKCKNGTAPKGVKHKEKSKQPTNKMQPIQNNEFKVSTSSNRSNERTPLIAPSEEVPSTNTTFPKEHYQRHSIQHEHQMLFGSNHVHRHPYDYISMAAAFLKDYEAARPPTLPSNIPCITPWQVGLYRLKHSTPYSILITSAVLALFLSSALEGSPPGDPDLRMHALSGLNLYALVVFATDMWIRLQFKEARTGHSRPTTLAFKKLTALPVMVTTRTSQAYLLFRPLCLFGLVLGLENMAWLLMKPNESFVVLYSSIWKPIVLYYVSSQARHAMEALLRIAKTVIKVLFIETILILSFAAVACRLFSDFDSFDHLTVAWLSLFKLATTVVNPSIWMPMYQETHWSAAYFVLFIVVIVFYMHSLVLSVVFQTYIQAATEIHDRSMTDREDALQLSFGCLKKQHQYDVKKQNNRQQQTESERKRQNQTGIPMYLVREVLQNLRPHYNPMKINALLEIFEKCDANNLDYPTYRTKIRQALNASIRTARIASPLSMSIELAAVVVAITNFIYVILLTSSFSGFDYCQLEIGSVITIAGLVELVMRTNPFRVQNFTPMTRFNSAFDGLAIAAAAISCTGIVMYIFHQEGGLAYILMGRAVDMVRVMRFFPFFRDVVRRSSDVLPAMTGPVTLVLTMLHIFVYIGMALWGGAIEVGILGASITPLYDLNNFNSYLEGMVTMFQVLVVNDWHAIAEVYLHASRCSAPQIVYPFFIIGNLIGVSILLNVITAFFVESFVTKLSVTEHKDPVAGAPVQDFRIKSSHNSSRRITSSNSLLHLADEDYSDAHDADSEGSSDSSGLFEFDVFEREGYDKIIQTISGGDQHDDFARQVCSHLEIFESLTPGREKVGYLVVCQQSMSRYGNVRFESEAADFIEKTDLHGLVSEMHGEILVLSSKDSFAGKSLIRVFSHPTDPSKQLEVSATVLRRHPALSLFVSRVSSPSME